MSQSTSQIAKIISQIVRVSEVFDENVDRGYKNDKSCHICSKRLKKISLNSEGLGNTAVGKFFSVRDTENFGLRRDLLRPRDNLGKPLINFFWVFFQILQN